MQLKGKQARPARRQTPVAEWEKTVEALAIKLCPLAEWQEYERQMQAIAWRANRRKNGARVRVFPIWRKYRQQALGVATLYQAAPCLRHLPIPMACFLGELLLK